MNRLRDYRKREVVAVAEGLVLGRPQQLIIDFEAHRVGVIVLQSGSTPETSLVIPASEVHSFGADTLAVNGLGSLDLAYRHAAALELMERAADLYRDPVVTTDGNRLGRVVEVDVDDAGLVAAYLVRHRWFGWFRRKLSFFPQQLVRGEDVFVVPEGSGALGDGGAERGY